MPSLLCPLCGETEDSVAHRCWQCQHPDVAAARAKVCNADFIIEAAEKAEQDAFFTMGV